MKERDTQKKGGVAGARFLPQKRHENLLVANLQSSAC
jgi:hypothetical protein